MKITGLILVACIGILLIYSAFDLPELGDENSPAASHISPYYIQHTLEDTKTPNIVTSVLADYRGYDTLGETTVVFTAGIACILLLRNSLKKGKKND